MNEEIFCVFLQRKAEKQDYQVYPGELGRRIYNEISKEAWNQWKDRQTILINEKRLTTINSEHRKFLEKEMIAFLFEKEKRKSI